MGDDIGSGSVCFDFRSTNIVQLSYLKYVVYGCLSPIDNSSSWTWTDVITHESPILTHAYANLELNYFWNDQIYTWSKTEVGRQFRCWTCVQTNKQANLEEEKYQMKSHPALNIELKKKKKKLVKLKKEVEKKCRKLLID